MYNSYKMSKYYRPKRNKNIYNPASRTPFSLSRSRLELFINCPRCFYIDRRLGTDRPPGFPFTINSAIDTLLKKEFDIHRAKGNEHPLIKQYAVDAKPVAHEMLGSWRNNFVGIRHHHKPTNLIIYGAIDDLWINSDGEYIVVDYKATAVNDEIVELNKDHHESYKRQMEIYQWLLRRNDFRVSNTGYFVYANGRTDSKAFDGKLEFDVTLIAHTGDDYWVETSVINAKKCLDGDTIPDASPQCDYCAYAEAVGKLKP
jgi:hypothetical protein